MKISSFFTIVLFLTLSVNLSFADTHYVSKSGNDAAENDCTNQETPCLTISKAVSKASSTDTVSVGAGTYSETISINKTLTLEGEATATTIIDGGGTDFCVESDDVPSGPTIIIRKFTIQNCEHVNTGAAIYVVGGFSSPSLTLEDVYLYNNFISTDSGFGPGGVHFRSGNSLVLNRVTFENNSGPKGAALFIESSSDVTLNNVTFINNNSTVNPTDDGNYNLSQGGAIWTNSETIIKNCTFYNNVSSSGNAIYRSANTVTVTNSILTGTGNDCSGTVTSGGYNLVSDSSCSFASTGDVESVADMGLNMLADNGGEVQTMSLNSDSPALDAGNNATCDPTDARGESRPADGDNDETATCDIGAYEVTCGDGIVDAQEACDDGNSINTDACLNTCEVASCGDGVVRSGVEECDNGGSNSDSVANACRTDCTNSICGDGVTDTDEGCDDGNDSNTDSCLNTCAVASCGDGLIQSNSDEVCDDGNDNSNSLADACRTTCVAASCGDGVADTGEACDDGNSSNADACLSTCEVASCGDGVVRTGIEDCDSGDDNSDTIADACRTDCIAAGCGDGVIDTGETCDDNNTDELDGCSSLCVIESQTDLVSANSSVNFSSLTTGESFLLAMPDPTPTSNINSVIKMLATDDECTCSWSVNPSDFGTFDDATTCTPEFTVNGTTYANLSASADCGATGTVSANQTLIVGSASTNSESSGGGCSLRTDMLTKQQSSHHGTELSLTLFLLAVLAGLSHSNRKVMNKSS